MRYVVTGGAGFIGSHLVDTLLAQGHSVVALDNLATGRRSNIEAALAAGATFVHCDIVEDTGLLAETFAGADAVFHLAGLADIVPSIERPGDYFRANVDGTYNVMEAMRAAGVKRIVYAASSSCYGIPASFPTPETATISPQYPYALTKYLGEHVVMHWGTVYGMTATSLRLFNVYGPRSRTSGTYGAVFGVFLAQKLAGKPFTVVGDGEQTRDFTFVTDVAEAFARAAQADVGGAIMNVGSGGTYSINRLVGLLGGPIAYVPKRPGEPDCTFADVTAIRQRLGWSARVGFDEGVGRMLASIDAWRDAPVWDAASIADATKTWFTYLGRESAPEEAVR